MSPTPTADTPPHHGLTVIRRLHEHRMWSNANLMRAAATLDAKSLTRRFEIGRGTLLDTLVHLYAAEHIWLAAIEGDPDPRPPWAYRFTSLPELADAWPALDRRWLERLDALADAGPAELNRPVRKTSTSSPAAQPIAVPLLDVLLHVCTHAQYTTAQAVNMLRRLGVPDLPDSMLITLSRSRHARASADS